MTPHTRLSADVTRARLVRSDISGANDAVTRAYLAEYEENGQSPRRDRDTQGEILRDPEGKVAASRSSSEIHPARPAPVCPPMPIPLIRGSTYHIARLWRRRDCRDAQMQRTEGATHAGGGK